MHDQIDPLPGILDQRDLLCIQCDPSPTLLHIEGGFLGLGSYKRVFVVIDTGKRIRE
jgi:hypothetical protein